jgi:rod shape determining protein RodA
MKPKLLERFDYYIFSCVLILTGLGIAFIYSSGINSDGVLVSKEYIKQIIWASIGLVILFTVAFYDYRKLSRIAPTLYAIGILVLIYTKIFGKYVNGARSWFGIGELGIQPSEITKIIFILFLAWYLERSQEKKPLKRFLTALAILLLPMLLILIQPDLGTATVYLPIFLVMCFMADIPLRYLMLVLCGGLTTLILTVLPIWQTEIFKKTVSVITVLLNYKLFILVVIGSLFITLIGYLGQILFKKRYFYWITYVFGIITFSLIASAGARKILKPYQIQRLIVFLDPSSDPLGSGWNIIQSKVAIGSGSLFGRGFMQGTQSHYRFLPQQSTDFIFSILGEEFGFVGGLLVFILFLIILIRIIYIIRQTSNVYGYYISSGILGMFFFHFIVNVGMVMGIMPITGIPLPFLSYGGSALITNMIAIGLLLSINSRKLDFTAAL